MLTRTSLLVVAGCLILTACLESNPQPSPAGGEGIADRADTVVPTADMPTGIDEPEDAIGSLDAATADILTPPDPCVNGLCPAGSGAAPDPSEKGPYPVGVRTFDLELKGSDGKPRSIRYEVWYPTTEEFRDGPFDAIDFYKDAPDYLKETVKKYEDALPPIPVDAVRDAPVRAGHGPYPLVMFSHGAYGIRFQSVFFTIPLASHGYVVAAPDHDGNVLYNLIEPDGYNMDDLIVSALNRPLDATAVIDDMLTRNDTGSDPFFETVDPAMIGAAGHSFGGYTALYLGFVDERIGAVLAMEPATTPFPMLGFKYEDFQAPVMFMAGKLDATLDTDVEMYQPFLKMPSPRYYFELLTGGHFTYSDICILDLLYIANDLGIEDADNALNDGCADFNIPTETAHPIINQFGIGYFNFYLRGSQMSAQYFDEAAASQYKEILFFESVP